LGALGPAAKETIPDLTELLKDENNIVRGAATLALNIIQREP